MKKIHIIVAALLLSLVLSGTLYAKYIKGLKVVSKTEDSVTVKDKDGVETTIQAKSSRYKIGDPVKYDPKRNKLRLDVEPAGC